MHPRWSLCWTPALATRMVWTPRSDVLLVLGVRVMGDGATFTSNDPADGYENTQFGPEKPDCVWLSGGHFGCVCLNRGVKDEQVKRGIIDADMAAAAVCFDCIRYRPKEAGDGSPR